MYFGKPVVKPTIGDDLRAPEPGDIDRTNGMMFIAAALMAAAIAAIAALVCLL